MKYNISNIGSLRKCLYYSNIHDATLIGYRYHDTVLTIELFNAIQNVRIIIRFIDVVTIQYRHGTEFGDSGTVLSLTVEDDIKGDTGDPNDTPLYLLFQMFSADELLIGAQSVTFDENPI